jgi:hypothetical protein
MSTTKSIQYISGNGQSGTVGVAFPLPLVVIVTTNMVATAGIAVQFSDGGAGGSFSVNPAISDGSGHASTFYTPPNFAGVYTVTYTGANNNQYFPAGITSFTLNAATGSTGKAIYINTYVSVTGKVVSVSGSGTLAVVTVQAPFDAGTFTAQARDCAAVQQTNDASHPASSINGKSFGAVGDDITVLGLCTAITGVGGAAVATITLINSQATITTATGNCVSTTS